MIASIFVIDIFCLLDIDHLLEYSLNMVIYACSLNANEENKVILKLDSN